MWRVFLKLLRRRKLQADLDAELAHHRELARMHGNPIGFGNMTLTREKALDLWRFNLIENLGRDLAYAARGLRRNPAFATAAALSLALGIGVTTAMFTLLNAVAFRPLPYSDPDRLLWMTQVLKGNSTDEVTITPDFLDWHQQNHTFTDLAGYNYVTENLTCLDESIEVHAARSISRTPRNSRRSPKPASKRRRL